VAWVLSLSEAAKSPLEVLDSLTNAAWLPEKEREPIYLRRIELARLAAARATRPDDYATYRLSEMQQALVLFYLGEHEDAKMLARVSSGTVAPVEATLVGGFNHDAAAGPFAQFSGLIDRVGAGGDATRAQGQEAAGNGNTPAFFSGDLAGLSRTFAAMQSERVVERRDGPVVRQTVTYVWQH
jgi:hypothetical protein